MEIKKLELKKIKFLESMSEETNCYQAVVYVNGKAMIDVSNRGHGGPDDQYREPNAPNDIVEQVDAYCKKNFSASLFSFVKFEEATDKDVMYCDLELWCSERITDYLIGKDVAKMTRKKVSFVRDGKIFNIKTNGIHTVELITAYLQKQESKDVFIFNNVSKVMAIAKMKEITGGNPHSKELTPLELHIIQSRAMEIAERAEEEIGTAIL